MNLWQPILCPMALYIFADWVQVKINVHNIFLHIICSDHIYHKYQQIFIGFLGAFRLLTILIPFIWWSGPLFHTAYMSLSTNSDFLGAGGSLIN